MYKVGDIVTITSDKTGHGFKNGTRAVVCTDSQSWYGFEAFGICANGVTKIVTSLEVEPVWEV